jgi:hypothetical protein
MLELEQKQRALEVMRAYLSAPRNPDGTLPKELHAERDQKRVTVIESQLAPLVHQYLTGKTPITEFKSEIDSINKKNEFWGFRGIKGQMFFNMILNVADSETESDQEIKAAIAVPANEDIAASRIKTFASYVKRLGDQFVEGGGTKHGRPKVSSVPFFLSYFWQIQDRATWPVFYTNSVNVMTDLNLWQPSDDLAEDYLAFKHIHEELERLFSAESGEKFGLYEVEHVFWFKGGNPFGGDKPIAKEHPKKEATAGPPRDYLGDVQRLPDSYIPPVIALLPRIAQNDERLVEPAKASGTTLDRAFEKNINAAFTILGYDTKPLGAGQGRVPDGLALDVDNSYAIIWDAKVRRDAYSMGTDDRTIREYIVTQSKDLRRRRGFRNIYYVIVSSGFADDYDDEIRTLKMETDVSEVILMEAEALVAMVDMRLRDPLHISLGPDGLQRLFTVSGVLSADAVREMIV